MKALNFHFFDILKMLLKKIQVAPERNGVQEVEGEVSTMSTSQIYLSQDEIDELIRDIPSDTSILYGEKDQEFGVCPYITFYLFHSADKAEFFVNQIIDIYD